MSSLRDAAPIAFLATTDAARARAFYEDVLGLDFVTDDGFALVFDSAGTTLRIARVESFEAQPFTVLGWLVADIEASVLELRERDVSFERYPGLEQDELAVWTSPSGARVSWFKDPDRNTLSLTQPPRTG